MKIRIKRQSQDRANRHRGQGGNMRAVRHRFKKYDIVADRKSGR